MTRRIAYVLSRTTGIPGDSGDIGNWGYMLGTVSLIVEGSLFLIAVSRIASLLCQRADRAAGG